MAGRRSITEPTSHDHRGDQRVSHSDGASAPQPRDRRLVLVAGAGRSGTSLMTGILAKLGMSVPQPEVTADETNPRGFGEPRWVVDFHTRLMRTRRMTSLDGRTNAPEMAAKAADNAKAADVLRSWLEVQFVGVDQVVVKDPRIVWFLPLWDSCARDLGVTTGVVTMLRYPTEVIASARTWYGDWQTNPSRACGWINVMLQTERISRDLPRAYVSYPDLLSDWKAEVNRVGTALDIASLVDVDAAAAASVDEFVDPGLHRQTVGWEDMGVPQHVRELSDEVWDGFVALTHESLETEVSRARMDGWREDYARLYTEAEQIAQSTIRAALKDAGKPVAAPAAAGSAAKKATTGKPGAAKGAAAVPRGAARRVAKSSARRLRSSRTARVMAGRLRNSPAARRAYRRVARLLGS
jgi:hypothetical protein